MRKEISFRWLGTFTKAVTNETIKTESPERRALLRKFLVPLVLHIHVTIPKIDKSVKAIC